MHGLLEQVWQSYGLPSCKAREADSLLDLRTFLDVKNAQVQYDVIRSGGKRRSTTYLKVDDVCHTFLGVQAPYVLSGLWL